MKQKYEDILKCPRCDREQDEECRNFLIITADGAYSSKAVYEECYYCKAVFKISDIGVGVETKS